jgi:hypothetical protein
MRTFKGLRGVGTAAWLADAGRVGKTQGRLSVPLRRVPLATLFTAALAVTLALAPTAAMATTTTAISAGGLHTCALRSTGAMDCWGENEFGELGDGTSAEKTTPTAVSGLSSGVTAVSAGYVYTCALTRAHGVYCWGENLSGQLGDGTTTEKTTPTAVSGLSSGITAISASAEHTCALTSAGGVKCWGANESGQLGDGTTTNKATPTVVSGLSSGVTAISAGGYHTCALTSAGAVKCWGYNADGQLGDGTTTNKITPAAVSGLSSGVTAISAGLLHTCALRGSGGLQCWGENELGQLGDGTTTNKTTPTDVSGLSSGVAAINAGYYHTCALTSVGRVKCWGYNHFGELGDGTNTNKTTPTDVSGLVSATCTTNTGTIKLSPGLSDKTAIQTMKIKGTLGSCAGEPFAQTKYTATLRTAGAVSCSVLKEAGEAFGAVKYQWTPSAKASKGTLNMLLSETPPVAFSGEVASGTYSPLTFSGTATESYDGAATCSTTPVKKGVFSGSAVNFE